MYIYIYMHTRITISVIIVVIITIIIIVLVVVVLIYTRGFRDAESRNRICVNGTIGATARQVAVRAAAATTKRYTILLLLFVS